MFKRGVAELFALLLKERKSSNRGPIGDYHPSVTNNPTHAQVEMAEQR